MDTVAAEPKIVIGKKQWRIVLTVWTVYIPSVMTEKEVEEEEKKKMIT